MVTRDDVKRFFGGDDCKLFDVEITDLVNAANADPHETADWLPYYKMALNRLVECCGVLRALAGEYRQTEHYAKLMKEAGRLYYEHLLLAGIGPRESPETIRRVEKIAAESLKAFLAER